MLPDLEKAMLLLIHGGYTCVLCRDDEIHTSSQRGVKPLMDWLDQDFTGFCAADKVVGKATALLYCLLKIRAVHACVVSQSALEVLQSAGIQVSWDQQVPHIINRMGTGRCPMELATQNISDPKAAPEAIRQALDRLPFEKQ